MWYYTNHNNYINDAMIIIKSISLSLSDQKIIYYHHDQDEDVSKIHGNISLIIMDYNDGTCSCH